MKWENVTQPAAEPVTYAQAKAHLRLDDDAEQAWLTERITAARIYAENVMQRSLVARQVRATWYDREKPLKWVPLPRGPVKTIDAVKDADGNALAADAYELRRIGTVDYLYLLADVWPVAVTYTAGFGTAADVPADIRTGILMHVAHLWRNREAMVDKPQQHVAHGLEAVYAQHRAGGVIC